MNHISWSDILTLEPNLHIYDGIYAWEHIWNDKHRLESLHERWSSQFPPFLVHKISINWFVRTYCDGKHRQQESRTLSRAGMEAILFPFKKLYLTLGLLISA